MPIRLAALSPRVAARSPAAAAAELPIFDAHVHYSHDAWENLPPQDAIAILRKAGLQAARWCRAPATKARSGWSTRRRSSSIPSLRPYRTRGDVEHVGARRDGRPRSSRSACASSRYAAIGEFHLYGADADLPVPQRMIALAQQHKLVLHAHSDVDAIERHLPAGSRRRASCGRTPASSGRRRCATMLRKHKNLWCDLAFRTEHGGGGKVPAEWRALFTEFPDRFMVGTDTFTPERWHYIVEHANWSRAWLADLPPRARRAHRVAQRRGAVLVLEAAVPRNDPRCIAAVAWMRVRRGARLRRSAVGHAARRARTVRRRVPPRRPAPIEIGEHFAIDFAVCPRDERAAAAVGARRREHARAPARHELPRR